MATNEACRPAIALLRAFCLKGNPGPMSKVVWKEILEATAAGLAQHLCGHGVLVGCEAFVLTSRRV